VSSFYIFVVPPTSPATTLEEFIELAKSRPGELNFAAASIGTNSHLVTELLKSKADGLDILHIPYNGGGPATTAALAGEVDFYGAPYATAKPLVDEGKLRALAVTSMERAPDLPDVPAVAEIVPGFEFTTWYGLSVPKGTPADVRDKLYEATQQALDDPATMQKIAELGYTAIKELRRNSPNSSNPTSSRYRSSSRKAK
jgi:tripartite-type tricarboxylate transporter receptor subunit TctC